MTPGPIRTVSGKAEVLRTDRFLITRDPLYFDETSNAWWCA